MAMIIDVHTHIFPPEVIEDRNRFLKSEPFFKAIYENPQARMVSAEGLIQAMDRDGVDISWAMGFPWVQERNSRLHNDYLAYAAKRFPQRLRCLACVHPPRPWAVREAERSLGLGLHGIGELAFYDSDLNLDSLRPLALLCRQAEKPMLLHTNEPVGHIYPGKSPMTLGALYRFIKENPELKLVLAHMAAGLFFYSLLKKEVSETLANVWIDTAAAPFLFKPEAYGLAVRLLGREKVLLGSDYPLLPVSRYKKELGSPEAGLTSEDLGMIMGGAAAGVIA